MSGTAPTRDAEGALHFIERTIPLPRHLSEAAKQVLRVPRFNLPDFEEPKDAHGWRDHIAQFNKMFMDIMAAPIEALGMTASAETLGGAQCYRSVPAEVPEAYHDKVVLDFHGGAFIYLAGDPCRLNAMAVAAQYGAPVVSVDYRIPPAHPFPAAVDDGVAAYRALLETTAPEKIIVSGMSAGGNIAAATLLKARDAGLPMPKAAIFISPAMDMSEGGDSFQTLRGVDPVLSNGTARQKGIYIAGADVDEPLLSPFRGDFSKGFPTSFVQAGTRDLLLSSAVLFHRALRRADVPAELHVFEAMPHGGFGGTPEDFELTLEIRKFIAKAWGA